MSKYVTGLKRNQIIQRWLQGIEDPDYEVFPTKKEGKYIVKKRATPIEVHKDPVDDIDTAKDPENDTFPLVEPTDDEQIVQSSITKQSIKAYPVLAKQSPKRTFPKKALTQNSFNDTPQAYLHTFCELPTGSYSSKEEGNSTINLEILEQLRTLGEELRSERVKKEQKQYIKHVVNKELTKSRIRNRFQYEPDNQYELNEPSQLNDSQSDTSYLQGKLLKEKANDFVSNDQNINSYKATELSDLDVDENKQPLTNKDSQVQPEFKSRIRRS